MAFVFHDICPRSSAKHAMESRWLNQKFSGKSNKNFYQVKFFFQKYFMFQNLILHLRINF